MFLMKKLGVIVGLVFILCVGLVFAMTKPDIVSDILVGPSGGHAVVSIPFHAVELAPGVFDLGQRFDFQSGKYVQGYAFALRGEDNRKFPAKPGTVCGNGVCEAGENAKKCAVDCGGGDSGSDTSSCYGFIAKNTKWKVNEDYIVDATNSAGLSESFIRSNLAFDIQVWEDAAGFDIFGEEVSGVVDIASIGNSLNGKNYGSTEKGRGRAD